MLKIIPLIAVGLLLVGAAIFASDNGAESSLEKSDTTIPSSAESAEQLITSASYQGQDWTLKNLAGETIQLSEFEDQPVLLVYWATWCPYCKKLLPGIQRLHEKYADQGLKIIAVNIREDGDPAAYWKKHGYTFEVALEGDATRLYYGVNGTPTLVFIGLDGKVLGAGPTSDPDNPVLDRFATEQLAAMKELQSTE